MTRVWSLSRSADDTQESQLLIVWKNGSNMLSFDSGYQSSINSHSLDDSTQEYDVNFNDFEESDDFSQLNEDEAIRYGETQVNHILNARVQSSPIPIPQTASRHHYSTINHTKSSFSSHEDHSLTSSTLSHNSTDSVHCLIGHPPYDCGCIRGYRHPYLTTNPVHNTQSNTQSVDNRLETISYSSSGSSGDERTEGEGRVDKKQCYPLPDIVSSSQNTTLMNEIIREIGADLRRISKDFITTRDQNIESPKISTHLLTRLIRMAIPLILKEVIQLF